MRRPGGQGDVGWDREWRGWRQRFLRPDGRVVDMGAGDVSHSEGQSYGLLLAEASGDRDSFEAVLGWTLATLRRPGDALLSWRYRASAPVKVEDPNNATDGDLLVAWALLRAAARWGNPAHLHAGLAMARDIRRLLLTEVGGITVLLPGASGFEKRDGVTVNPSYYAFAALQDLAQADPDPAWDRARDGGLNLLRAGLFGPARLPPDWLWVPAGRGRPVPAPDRAPRFSFDAVRVPLHLAWAGLREPALVSAAAFWGSPDSGRAPAWVDLVSGARPGYSAPAGQIAVMRLTHAAANGGWPVPGQMPSQSAAPDYYGASLAMLARLAVAEGRT